MRNPEKSGLSEIEAVKEIQKMEVENDLLQYQVDGWCFWPLLRFDVEAALVQLPFPEKKHFSRFEQALIALRDLPKLFLIKESHLVVKTYSSARLIEENGRKKDVFFDDLLDGVKNVLRIEGVNNPQMFRERNRAKVPALLTSLPFDIAAGVLSLLPGLAPDFSEMAEKISAAITMKPGLERFTAEKILRKARFFFWGIKLYGELLKRTGAKQLLVADPGEYLICAAARKKNIPVFEFQHGLVGPEYNSYYSWTRYALPYKNRMPIPNTVLLYGAYWQQKLQETGFWVNELRATGSILLDSYKQKAKHNKRDDCTILLTSQGLDRAKLIRIIEEFHFHARKSGFFKYHIFIKMHPIFDGEKSSFVKDLGDYPTITVLEAHDQPSTFDLLTKSNIHWSISSACHFDALGMGVPSVILGLKTHESVLPLFEKGYAMLAHDGKELFDATINWQAYSVPDAVRSFFYQSGALQNARKEIGLS